MTQILDLMSSSDPRDVIHRAVQVLAEGGVVGIALDTTYAVCVSAIRPDLVPRIADRLKSDMASVLVVSTGDAAVDFLPRVTGFQRRLVRRSWPGPVLLRFSGATRPGLADALPAEVRREVAPDDEIRLNVVESGCLREILQLLPGPLAAFLPPHDAAPVSTASQLAESHGDLLHLVIDAGPLGHPHPPTDLRLHSDRWELVAEGAVSPEAVSRQAATVVMFVCTGNTCRSPMAEAMFRNLLARRLQCPVEGLAARGFVVLSAGLSAACGMPAAPEAVDLMRRHGIRLDQHVSQPMTPELLSNADYVLTMTARHRNAIVDRFPKTASHVHTLAPDGSDVPDPIGAGPAEYRRCSEQIAGYLQHWLEEIVPAERRG